jgi:hypothetical protein
MSKSQINLPKTAFSMKANLPIENQKFLNIGKKLIYIKNLEILEKEMKNLSFMMGLPMQMEIFIWVLRLTRYLKIS